MPKEEKQVMGSRTILRSRRYRNDPYFLSILRTSMKSMQTTFTSGCDDDDDRIQKDLLYFQTQLSKNLDPKNILGREKELARIETVIEKSLKEPNKGCLILLLGKPGLGKSLVSRHLMEKYTTHGQKFKRFYQNCMNVSEIHLFKTLKKKTGMFVILDEIECLIKNCNKKNNNNNNKNNSKSMYYMKIFLWEIWE